MSLPEKLRRDAGMFHKKLLTASAEASRWPDKAAVQDTFMRLGERNYLPYSSPQAREQYMFAWNPVKIGQMLIALNTFLTQQVGIMHQLHLAAG